MFLFPRARAIEKELLKEKKDQSDKVYTEGGTVPCILSRDIERSPLFLVLQSPSKSVRH
jgi:hypothetical protein